MVRKEEIRRISDYSVEEMKANIRKLERQGKDPSAWRIHLAHRQGKKYVPKKRGRMPPTGGLPRPAGMAKMVGGA